MNKGFTLIENIVSLAIATMVILAISADVSTVLHYFIISDQIKNKSDSYYAKVQDPNANQDPNADQDPNANQEDGDYALSIEYYLGSDKPTNPDLYKNASVNNLSLVKSDSDTIDGVNISYYNFTSNVQLTDTKKVEYTNTVYDRINFKNADNDKGEWKKNKKNTYNIGDFVTYEDRQYVLVKKVTDQLASKTPGTWNSGWQLLDMYNPTSSLYTTYLEGDIFLQQNDKEIQAFVYLNNNNYHWLGAYDPETHEIKTEANYSYDPNWQTYFNEWKNKNVYLLDSWKPSE